MPEVNWRELYRAAMLELDPAMLQVRVKIAEDAINARAAHDARVPRDEKKGHGRCTDCSAQSETSARLDIAPQTNLTLWNCSSCHNPAITPR